LRRADVLDVLDVLQMGPCKRLKAIRRDASPALLGRTRVQYNLQSNYSADKPVAIISHHNISNTKP
jgi:hypothetical protein